MGHLDPFLQDLNGIGIIAMMVGISAVIVRVVFCKTMRDRIYTGVGGLISAIVMSLGIDYAIRPFAGTVDVLPVLKHRDSNTCCYRVEVSHVMAEASFPR